MLRKDVQKEELYEIDPTMQRTYAPKSGRFYFTARITVLIIRQMQEGTKQFHFPFIGGVYE